MPIILFESLAIYISILIGSDRYISFASDTEIMQGRIEQFVAEIVAQEGVTPAAAKIQVQSAIDTWVWYAGWCDKIDSISGSTNPVSGPFYNFSIPESLGVVAIFAEGDAEYSMTDYTCHETIKK